MRRLFTLVVASLAVTVGVGASTKNRTLQVCQTTFMPSEYMGYSGENLVGECSDRGSCEESDAGYFCVCEKGWTGRSDFIDASGYDCQVSLLAMKVLWGLNLGLAIVCALVAIPKMNTRINNYLRNREMRKEQGKTYRLSQNRGLCSLLVFYLACTPPQVAFALIKLLDEDVRIGYDWSVTLLFGIAKSGFYISVALFQPSLLAAVLKGNKATRHIVKSSDRFGLVIMVISVLLSFAPVISILVPEMRLVVLMVYGTAFAASLLGYAIQAFYVQLKVTSALEKSYSVTKLESTRKMKQRLSVMQKEVIRQGVAQCAVYFVFGLFPFMWTKHDYLLPITWLAMPIIGLKTAGTVTSSTENGTSKGASSFNPAKSSQQRVPVSPSTNRARTNTAMPSDLENNTENIVSYVELTEIVNDFKDMPTPEI